MSKSEISINKSFRSENIFINLEQKNLLIETQNVVNIKKKIDNWTMLKNIFVKRQKKKARLTEEMLFATSITDEILTQNRAQIVTNQYYDQKQLKIVTSASEKEDIEIPKVVTF